MWNWHFKQLPGWYSYFHQVVGGEYCEIFLQIFFLSLFLSFFPFHFLHPYAELWHPRQNHCRQLKNRGYENGDDGKFNVHEFVRDNTKAKSICAQCSF